MRQQTAQALVSQMEQVVVSPRAARILARSIFRELALRGVPSQELITIVGELVGLITEEIAVRQSGDEGSNEDDLRRAG